MKLIVDIVLHVHVINQIATTFYHLPVCLEKLYYHKHIYSYTIDLYDVLKSFVYVCGMIAIKAVSL